MSKPPNPQRRSERSREAILIAALDLCAELGYGGVTVEGIATRAGVSKKTIYRWWQSKGQVILDAVQDRATALPILHPDTGDIATDLRTQMRGVIALFGDPKSGAAIFGIVGEMQDDAALAETVTRDLIRPRVANARERLRRARDSGQLAPDTDLDLVIEMLYAPLYYRRLIFHHTVEPEHVDAIVNFVLQAAGPAAGPAGGAPRRTRSDPTRGLDETPRAVSA